MSANVNISVSKESLKTEGQPTEVFIPLDLSEEALDYCSHIIPTQRTVLQTSTNAIFAAVKDEAFSVV